MKLTVEELYNLEEGIGKLSKRELPTKTAFKIGRNNRKIADEIKTADEGKTATGKMLANLDKIIKEDEENEDKDKD